ncbi:exonuclease domain-containing protein [Metabacillus flavus]|uniref:exonuclease domain-containing protein n=1 Tax=Metabacillus flavus TaxID=2823519 RepID=UPI0020166647|nr:exonuclease domain-containing protein [Metabacillus flavus]
MLIGNKDIVTGMLVDVETTGLSPKQDEMIEIGILLFRYNQAADEFLEIEEKHSYLREPQSSGALANYPFAQRVHGIPFEAVQGQAFEDERVQEAFAKADFAMAHNASFDRSFICTMYPEAAELRWHCTVRHIPWKEYGFSNSKLLYLVQQHGLGSSQTHRALDDVMQLHALLQCKNEDEESYLKAALSRRPMGKYGEKKTGYRRFGTR